MRTEQNIDSGHTSVKVHAPPGGKSSFNIFGGQEQEATQMNERRKGGTQFSAA